MALRLSTLALALIALAPLPEAKAQRAVHSIGFLALGAKPAVPTKAFFEDLHALGYVEERTVRIERRYAAGDLQRLDRFANELAELKVDVIVALATPAAQAAQKATRTIPIVFFAVVDPLGAGLVSSLARPGGNATGISLLSTDISAKRLELLQEVVPKLTRVGVLWNPGNASNELQLREIEEAAKERSVLVRRLEIRGKDDVKPAVMTASQFRADALMAMDDPVIAQQASLIAVLATSSRIPTTAGFSMLVDNGFLVAYGPSLSDQFRRAAVYADRILKGAQPADMPVEQPRTFELVLNLKTARALGLAVPRSLLLRADRLIE